MQHVPEVRVRRRDLPSPISRGRPHCSKRSRGPLVTADTITDLARSASLQRKNLYGIFPPCCPSPISRGRPHCSPDVDEAIASLRCHHRSREVGLIAARAISKTLKFDGVHHRSREVGLIAAGNQASCTACPASITDLARSASLQHHRERPDDRVHDPSPISRGRPHCSTGTQMGGMLSHMPSPISRGRPHCSSEIDRE